MFSQLSVALLTTSFPLGPNSASGPFIEHLANHLAKLTPLEVIAPDDAETQHQTPRAYQIQTFRYAPKSLQRLAHAPGGIPALLTDSPLYWILVPPFLIGMTIAAIRAANRHQVILANWSICGAIAGIIGKLWHRPVITVLRGEDVGRGLKKGPFRWLLAICLKLSTRVVTVSPTMFSTIKDAFPQHAGLIHYIPNGISPAFFAAPPRGPHSKNLRLVCIGGLTPNKDHLTIINALALLPDTISLAVVGDGPQWSALSEQVKKLGLESQVTLLGNRPHSEIPSILRSSDLLILASHREGRPNVVLEAMAAGLPVIATDLPSIRELLPEEGLTYLFTPGNADELANAIQRFAAGPGSATLGLLGRQKLVKAGLTWERCASEYLNLVMEVVA